MGAGWASCLKATGGFLKFPLGQLPALDFFAKRGSHRKAEIETYQIYTVRFSLHRDTILSSQKKLFTYCYYIENTGIDIKLLKSTIFSR